MSLQRPRAFRVSRVAQAAGLIALTGCLACRAAAAPRAVYAPRTREITITTVPLLSKELTSTYPFLLQDLGPTGMMPGKEVYAFVPSTITVVEGDTLRLEFVNPEDDVRAFVLPDFVVLAPETVGAQAP